MTVSEPWTETTYWTTMTRPEHVPTYVDHPCPLCGTRFIWCIPLVDANDKFQHCKYLCCNWDCRWSGWFVP